MLALGPTVGFVIVPIGVRDAGEIERGGAIFATSDALAKIG
jgi:hypothetical protein